MNTTLRDRIEQAVIGFVAGAVPTIVLVLIVCAAKGMF